MPEGLLHTKWLINSHSDGEEDVQYLLMEREGTHPHIIDWGKQLSGRGGSEPPLSGPRLTLTGDWE